MVLRASKSRCAFAASRSATRWPICGFTSPEASLANRSAARAREILAGLDVVEQRRPAGVQRSAAGQVGKFEVGDRSRGLPETHEQAARLQALQRTPPGVIAHRIVNHIAAPAAGDLLDARGEIFRAIVDDVRVAIGLCDVAAFSAEPAVPMEVAPHGLQPLAHQQPHAARGRMHQHDIARFDRVAGIQAEIARSVP